QSERFLLADDRVESKIRQGITTEITGEGESIAPATPRLLEEVKPFDERYGIRPDWRDLSGYFRRFRATINLGTFVGAATVREMGEVLARCGNARAAGVDITANMYPYDAARNGLDANVPDWAHESGVDAMITRFHDPAQRARIEKELWHGGLGAETPNGILIAAVVNPKLEQYVGKRLDEIARAAGKTPEDALLDLV